MFGILRFLLFLSVQGKKVPCSTRYLDVTEVKASCAVDRSCQRCSSDPNGAYWTKYHVKGNILVYADMISELVVVFDSKIYHSSPVVQRKSCEMSLGTDSNYVYLQYGSKKKTGFVFFLLVAHSFSDPGRKPNNTLLSPFQLLLFYGCFHVSFQNQSHVQLIGDLDSFFAKGSWVGIWMNCTQWLQSL